MTRTDESHKGSSLLCRHAHILDFFHETTQRLGWFWKMGYLKYANLFIGLLLSFTVGLVRSEHVSRKNVRRDSLEARTPSYLKNTPTNLKRPRVLDGLYPTRAPFTCPPAKFDEVKLTVKLPKIMRVPEKDFNTVAPFHKETVKTITRIDIKPNKDRRQYKDAKDRRRSKDSKASKQSKISRSSWGRRGRGGKS